MRILDRSRPGVAAQGLGIAQGATDYALEYAKTRETMGRPIAQHQLVAAMLADMETKCEAARGLLYKFGQAVDEGIDGPELTKLSAMTKLYCTDVAMDVTTDAVQVLGGYGYIQEYPLERMMRDAKITQIYEGANQIQRLVIAREMVKEQRAFLSQVSDEARRHPPRHLHHGRRAAECRLLYARSRSAARQEVRQPGRPTVYHLFYADEAGDPGSDITFFEYPNAMRGRAGAGMIHLVRWRVASEDALSFWGERLGGVGVEAARETIRCASRIRKGSPTSSRSSRLRTIR